MKKLFRRASRREVLKASAVYGSYAAAAHAGEVMSLERKVYKQHFSAMHNGFASCPQCRLLGMPYAIRHAALRGHLIDHRIQRALGVEREWVADLKAKQDAARHPLRAADCPDRQEQA